MLLFSAISSFVSKGNQPSINQELSKESMQRGRVNHDQFKASHVLKRKLNKKSKHNERKYCNEK